MPFTIPSTLSDAERAYLAGFVDGEGSIMLRTIKAHHSRRDGLAVALTIGNTHEGVIRWIAAVVGAGRIEYRPYDTRPRNRPQWIWTVVSQGAMWVISEIRPFLIVKAQQADLVFELAAANQRAMDLAGGPFHRGRQVPDELIAFREECRVRMNGLNHGQRFIAKEAA